MSDDQKPIQIVGSGFFPLFGERERLREDEELRMASMQRIVSARRAAETKPAPPEAPEAQGEPEERQLAEEPPQPAVPIPWQNSPDDAEPVDYGLPDFEEIVQRFEHVDDYIDKYLRQAEMSGDHERADLLDRLKADFTRTLRQLQEILQTHPAWDRDTESSDPN